MVLCGCVWEIWPEFLEEREERAKLHNCLRCVAPSDLYLVLWMTRSIGKKERRRMWGREHTVYTLNWPATTTERGMVSGETARIEGVSLLIILKAHKWLLCVNYSQVRNLQGQQNRSFPFYLPRGRTGIRAEHLNGNDNVIMSAFIL